MPGRPAIPCVIYKDNKEIGSFDSLKEATKFLERKIGGNLYTGVKELLKGWVPPERSQLYGYSVKRIENDRA